MLKSLSINELKINKSCVSFITLVPVLLVVLVCVLLTKYKGTPRMHLPLLHSTLLKLKIEVK